MYLFPKVHGILMGEPENENASKKVTPRDIGRGCIFLGAVILALTILFFALSFMNEELFGLFSGQTHIAFDIIIGLALLSVGAILVRSKPSNAEESD